MQPIRVLLFKIFLAMKHPTNHSLSCKVILNNQSLAFYQFLRCQRNLNRKNLSMIVKPLPKGSNHTKRELKVWHVIIMHSILVHLKERYLIVEKLCMPVQK